MKITRQGSAVWTGDLKNGKGLLSTESGVFEKQPYNYKNRFENEKGTNPEELIGAAQAGCYNMALAMALGEAKFIAVHIETNAKVSIEEKGGGLEISEVNLSVKARIPGITHEQFEKIAQKAKENCPVSKLLKAKITLATRLEESSQKLAG